MQLSEVRPHVSLLGLTLSLVTCAQLGLITPVHAEPLVKMAWNSCNPSNLTFDYVTRELATAGLLELWIEGQTSASQGYELTVVIRSADGSPLAHAWRFDAGGCQPDQQFAFEFRNTSPSPSRCGPGLCEHSVVEDLILDRSFDPGSQELRLRLRVSYAPTTLTVNPATRYRAAEFYFGGRNSVFGATTDPDLCGGFEQAVCFRVVDARWQDPEGTWVPWAIDPTPVTAHGEGTPIPECASVPVHPASWGWIKSTYR